MNNQESREIGDRTAEGRDGTSLPTGLVSRYRAQGLWSNTTINERFEAIVAGHRGGVALVDGGARYTFGDLLDLVDRAADGLAAHGIAVGDVVGFQLPNCPEIVILTLALARIGALACPLHTAFRRHELEYRLGYTGAAALVIPTSFRGFNHLDMVAALKPRLPKLKGVWVLGGTGAGPAGKELPDGFLPFSTLTAPGRARPSGRRGPEPAPGPDDDAVLMFTSGTEGAPKGVVHTHNTFLSFATSLGSVLRVGPGDVSLAFAPMSLALGLVSASMMPLLCGATLVIQRRFDAEEALRLIEQERVTLLGGTSAHYRAMLDAPTFHLRNLTSVRLAGITGGPVMPDVARGVAEIFGCRVMARYGMTEGSYTATRLDSTVDEVVETSGKPMPGVELRLVDDGRRPVAASEVGEIAVRGPSLFVRYYGDPVRTRDTRDAEGWFYTGDLGLVDTAGNLRFVGRKKDVIVRGGMKINPGEIEGLLQAHPRIASAAMVGMPDDRLGERNCLYIVPAGETPPALEEVVGFLKSFSIATYKLPERLEVIDRMPLTSTLKIRKVELKQDVARKLAAEKAAAATTTGGGSGRA